MVSMAEPDSKQKQHSKTRTDMLVFRTSPITCSCIWFVITKVGMLGALLIHCLFSLYFSCIDISL
jgi:hypothetical protein